VDAFVAHAVSKGAEVLKPVADQFYGDRNAKLKDPAGHVWMFGTHIEDGAGGDGAARGGVLRGEK